MSEYFHAGGIILGLFIWCIAVVSFLTSVIYAIKTVRRARPGVTVWGRDTFWNPFNLLLAPDLLTDNGRSCRKKFLLAIAIYFGAMGAFCLLVLTMIAIEGSGQKFCTAETPDMIRASIHQFTMLCD